MSNAVDLTSDNFASTIANGVTLVDFWAEWCGPCKMMAPALDELADQYADQVTVAKVNVDNESELAQQHGVSSIPTLVIFKDGEEVKRIVGVTSKANLGEALDEALA